MRFAQEFLLGIINVLYPTPFPNVAQKDIEDLHGFSLFSHLIA
jgi:hypothetical protein